MLGLGALLGGQSVAFTLAFGTQGYAWRSVGHATMSLYHLVLGTHPSADPFALRHTNWVLGPLLYAFVVLLFYHFLPPQLLLGKDGLLHHFKRCR